ncbi:MAG TPA: hypothetical protein VEL04_03415 [Burkholderiales bacterium]|nr:hypothetical protein [Burkholderiales bacterium]
MKTLSILLIAAAALTGCAVVPYPEPAGVYVAPPVVVARPYYYGYYGYRGYYGNPYWHRGWR